MAGRKSLKIDQIHTSYKSEKYTMRILVLKLLTACWLIQAFTTSVDAAEGTLLVVNRNDGSVSLVDVQTGTESARLDIGAATPHEVAVSPDGRWAATGEYGPDSSHGQHVVIIDIPSAAISSRIDLGPDTRPHSLAFLSDNRHLVVTMQNQDRLALVDFIAGDIVKSWPTGGREGHMVRLAPDESRAYVTNRGGQGSLSVIWLNEDREPVVIPTGSRAEGIAVSPDGREVWVANQGDGTISVVDAQSLQVTASFAAPPTNRLEFLTDSRVVIPGGSNAAGTERYVRFHDPATKAVTTTLTFAGRNAGTGIRVKAADGQLFISDSALDAIFVHDPASGAEPRLLISNPDNPDGLAWSPLRVETAD
jgi:YVTN family beta-propeller protein